MNCPICNVDHPDTKILKCRNCNHIFRNFPLIDLGEYYTNYYRTAFKQELNLSVLKNRNNFRLRKIENIFSNAENVLEVGFGYGNFYDILNEKYPEKEYSCCELDSKLAESAIKKGIKTFKCSFQEVPEDIKYDAVISFDVLEHLYDPYEYKDKLLSILNPGGVAIIQVPTDRSIHFNQPFDGHYHYFSRESLTYLMNPDFENELFYKCERGESANGREFLTAWKLK
jgi:SAM-dependent methyltransferase